MFVRLGPSSRTYSKRYRTCLPRRRRRLELINWRFQSEEWRPIVFLEKHHTHQEILPFYRRADLCMVTSLHDGMNLVAKEFVASREDEGGVLILSRFAGASRELGEALIVNPYDVEQMAEAIRYALEMDQEERSRRMRRMRETVREHNIYQWAGNLITELTQIRPEPVPAKIT